MPVRLDRSWWPRDETGAFLEIDPLYFVGLVDARAIPALLAGIRL